jgi:hypothetical protein
LESLLNGRLAGERGYELFPLYSQHFYA